MPLRPKESPLGGANESAPDLNGRGRLRILEHETGLASGLCPRCATERSSVANRERILARTPTFRTAGIA
jgi:hypothetical protein